MVDQSEIHRMAMSDDVDERRCAVLQLQDNFEALPDKEQAWTDLIRIIRIYRNLEDIEIQFTAENTLVSAFSNFPNKEQAWETVHQLTYDKDENVRSHAAGVLGSIFPHLIEKELAYQDLHHLTKDEDSNVRDRATTSIGEAFLCLPNKRKAWKDLHRLTNDKSNEVLWKVAQAIGAIFSYIPDKEQAWKDLHRLTLHKDVGVRWEAAYSIGEIFPYVSKKKEAWDDLNRLAKEEKSGVCQPANYSLGRAYIFNAGEAISKEDLEKELKNALIFFTKSMNNYTEFYSSDFQFAEFCLPFYRCFYTLIFKKEEADAEVQRYLLEAKNAIEGSESKEKLLEAIETLGNALKEAQKTRDFNSVKSDLNAYRRYCERACELLKTTEENAPGASRLIRKGLPIIDERIKGIIGEIQEKANALCKQVQDTEFKEIGQQVNNVGKELSKVINPIRLEKEVSHMLIPLTAMCGKMPEEDRGEACELLKQINEEQNVEDKLPLISMFLSKISTQMNKEQIMANIHIENSEGAQVIVGTGNKQVHESNFSLK